MVTRAGAEVEAGEALGDLVEQLGFTQPLDLHVETEALEDIAHHGREGGDVGLHVRADMVGVAEQLRQIERGGVVEGLVSLP